METNGNGHKQRSATGGGIVSEERTIHDRLISMDMSESDVELLRSPKAVEVITDKERLDWLAKNLTINQGLAVGGYWFRSDLRWQGNRIREAIDTEMKKEKGIYG